MTDDPNPFWWYAIPTGQRVLLGFVMIDRAGSTRDWEELPEVEVFRLRRAYSAGIESIARAAKSVPPHWHGDGAMLMFDNSVEPAPLQAFYAARLLWERARFEIRQDVRIAVHAGEVAWNPDLGKMTDRAIDLCGHLQGDAPINSIAMTEDVYLMLPADVRKDVVRLGITKRDAIPTYGYPLDSIKRRDAARFEASDDLTLWDAFRKYVHTSPEVARLRYAGFRLTKKEPPSLAIEEVFVGPEVSRRARRLSMDSDRAFSRSMRERATANREPAGADAPRILPWLREEASVSSPEPFRDVFAKDRAVVVLGDPGSGKTTLVKWLAVQAAKGAFVSRHEIGVSERLLPLPVSVGRLAEIRRAMVKSRPNVSVVEALARYFHDRSVGESRQIQDFLSQRLDAGNCLVLLDGLDEVLADERRTMRDWLEAFAVRYNRNRFVVTSRIVGYDGFDVAGAEPVVLQPFSDAQVEKYLGAFCRAYLRWESNGVDNLPAAKRAANDLLDALKQNPRLAALARNPFLLSGLALIQRAEGKLPRYRVKFYDTFAQALCETWENARRIVASERTGADRKSREMSYEGEAIPILGYLAVRMHEEWPAGAAPERFVVQTLAEALKKRRRIPDGEYERVAKEFLSLAGPKSQILVERGAGAWGFLHLTFQEFFAAAGLHAAGQFEQRVYERLFDPRWEEVIRLGIGYLAIVQRNEAGVTRIVQEVLKGDKVAPPGREWIVRDLHANVPFAVLLAAEAGDTLAESVQEEVIQAFMTWRDQLHPESLDRHVLEDLVQTEFGDALAERYIEVLRNGELSVRRGAVEALGQLKAESAVGPLLEALKTDKEESVRYGAAYALGQLKAESAVGPLLETLKTDTDRWVRGHAAEALSQLKAESAVGPLVEVLKTDEDGSVRSSAARSLGELKAESAVGPLLETLKTDKDGSVRGSAAEALGQLKAESAVRPLLEVLKTDEDGSVRHSAVEALWMIVAGARPGQ